jgi:hypothetical protein
MTTHYLGWLDLIKRPTGIIEPFFRVLRAVKVKENQRLFINPNLPSFPAYCVV